MPTLNLEWRLYAGGFGTLNSQAFGFPVNAFNVQGGKIQPLMHGEYIANEMLISDELKDAIYRRNLYILRDSDAFSLELYRAYGKRTKFFMLATVNASGSAGGLVSSAHLSISNATIKKFDSGYSGVGIEKKNMDGITFVFDSKDADIHYTSNASEIFMREVARIGGAIGKSLAGIGKQIGI